MRRRFFLVLGAVALAVAACQPRADKKEPASAPEAQAYRHAISEDLSGDYRPLSPVRAGGVELVSVFVGQASAFEAWEQGRGGSAPVLLTLRTGSGETKVGPTAYRVTEGVFRFEGVLGAEPIEFKGRLDAGALATARRNLGDQTAVLTGTLTIGGAGVPARLSWWGGD